MLNSSDSQEILLPHKLKLLPRNFYHLVSVLSLESHKTSQLLFLLDNLLER